MQSDAKFVPNKPQNRIWEWSECENDLASPQNSISIQSAGSPKHLLRVSMLDVEGQLESDRRINNNNNNDNKKGGRGVEPGGRYTMKRTKEAVSGAAEVTPEE